MNPASQLGRLGKGKPKTMTPAAIKARQKNGKLGGRPKKSPTDSKVFGTSENKI